jgi:hypothetical protein
LEVGVAAAGLTRLWVDLVTIRNVYTLDLKEHDSVSRAYAANAAAIRVTANLYEWVGNSHSREARAWLDEWRDKGVKFDLAFIDGDHGYDGLLRDIELVIPHIQDGGFLALHDHVAVDDVARLEGEMRIGRFPTLSFRQEWVDDTPRRKGIALYARVSDSMHDRESCP